MKTQFKKASSFNYKTFGLKSNNGSTHFGNKSLTSQQPQIIISHDKEPVKHFELQK
jgi:hypothetical protein